MDEMKEPHVNRESLLENSILVLFLKFIKKDTALCKNTIRKKQLEEIEYCSNELHETFIKKTRFFFLKVSLSKT